MDGVRVTTTCDDNFLSPLVASIKCSLCHEPSDMYEEVVACDFQIDFAQI